MVTVCLTHDVDRVRKTYQYLTKTMKAIGKGYFVQAAKMVGRAFDAKSAYWGFDTVIDVEQRYGIKSTFFFLEESARIKWNSLSSYKIALGRYHVAEPKVAEMIRFLYANGWEIGLHGSYYSYNNPALLKQEKATLEAVVGHPVIGIRQHYLHLNELTWSYQQEAGFKYDSSWGYTDAIGYKQGKIQPFFPIEGTDFCEIPLTIMDSCFEEEKDRWEQLQKIIKQAEDKNAIIVINFHTNNFDEVEYPANKSNYIRLIEMLQEHGAKFMTMGEAYKHILSFFV